MLPLIYQEIIERYLSSKSTKTLEKSFKKLSEGYRFFESETLGSSKEDVDAYLVGRLPLTWAVLSHVFTISKSYFSHKVKVIDYGSGPGTALLALHHAWGDLDFSYQGIEEKEAMIQAATYMASELALQADFKHSDVLSSGQGFYDLAIASYVLNELKDEPGFFKHLITYHDSIIIIEPGTPDGTSRILRFRDFAIKNGFNVIMPCPHNKPCPLVKPQWCHFYERVERSKLLKTIKGGSLGYEDEKYMFIFVSKSNMSDFAGVIINKPKALPYQVELDVCSKSGDLLKEIIIKKDRENFKKAKKLKWGDFL